MSHKKEDRTIWQHRFNLSSDNPAHVRLHEHLSELSGSNEASRWVIGALIAALPARVKGIADKKQPSISGGEELHYEDVIE